MATRRKPATSTSTRSSKGQRATAAGASRTTAAARSRAAATARSDDNAAAPSRAPSLVDIAQQLRSWTGSALGVAGAAADVTLGAAKMMLPKPGQRAALARAGAVLRRLRETAGLNIDELGHAINVKDPALLELVENGKVALPFEIILRLASVLGRNDPISFVMRFTRSYNPDVWKTLESLGVGRLAVQAGREREFANLYRASDAARSLSDEEFGEVLKFMQAAFSMALVLRAGTRRPDAGP